MQQLFRLADEVDALASVLARMPLASHKAPEAPHEARAEICRALFSTADRLRKGLKQLAEQAQPAPKTSRRRQPVPSAKGIHGVYVNDGAGSVRYVPVTKR